jgi:hypothetical protein
MPTSKKTPHAQAGQASRRREMANWQPTNQTTLGSVQPISKEIKGAADATFTVE